MKTITETFWENLNGRIVCKKHLGSEALFYLAKRPAFGVITTSMTKWVRMTKREATEFSELVGLDHTICETCRSGK